MLHAHSRKGRGWMPVAFVSSMIAALYLIYMQLHVFPKLEKEVDRAVVEVYVFSAVTALMLICYLCCIFVHPGTVPADDPKWDCRTGYGACDAELRQQECKRKTGERRVCKWCLNYKPDRCHHCKICGVCILKMDHHCPWIYNCVGFKNHKYFFLFILYASIASTMVVWTMHSTVVEALQPSVPFRHMFLLVFGQTLAGFLGLASSMFLCFHTYLMLNAITTIEFCEQKMPEGAFSSRASYDRGVVGNIQAVLGDNPLFWLLPCWPAPGSGLAFETRKHQAEPFS